MGISPFVRVVSAEAKRFEAPLLLDLIAERWAVAWTIMIDNAARTGLHHAGPEGPTGCIILCQYFPPLATSWLETVARFGSMLAQPTRDDSKSAAKGV